MSNMRTRALTLAVTAAIALTSFSPSFAIQMPAAPAATAAVRADDVQQVQYWRHHGDGYYRGGGYRGRGYYGGYRGYDGYRHGYRYHNGYWFPLAAFGAGALIGGAIASDQPRVYARPSNGINPRHYEWCANRYRSYRGYDNTFQPNHGPRRQCLSPFY